MRILLVCSFSLLGLLSAVAQDALAAKPSGTQAAGASSQMPEEIESTLKKYVAAYERLSVPDLVAVWPDLQNQKKELGKIKGHFSDPKISNEHMTVRPLETQVLKDDSVVRCERVERFNKTRTSETGGDLIMNRSPAQTPAPNQTTVPVEKKDTVWVKLHKNQDGWLITSVSEKPLSF